MIFSLSTRRAVKRRAANVRIAASRYVAAATKRTTPLHNSHYRSGRAWEKAGEWAKAAEAYHPAVEDDPNRPGWYFRLGKVRGRAGEWSKAAEAYQAAVDGDPGNPEWYFQLGRAWEKAGHPFGAVAAYQVAVSRDPNQPDWFYRLGAAFLKIRNYHSASYSFRQADSRFRESGQPGQPPPSHRLPYERRLELSLLVKPAYAYCIYRGAQLAERLGIERISVLELGVAGGRGLRAMESHAAEIEQLTGVQVSVFGLDTGEGLYQPADYRDMPYYFAPGHYRMDVDKLESKLERAHLILGDARETFAAFVEGDHPPIAAVSFDMDYYSSTSGVLEVVGRDKHERSFLPRVYTYFDNVAGYDSQDYNEFTGELLAIAEFNERHPAKFAPDRHFMAKQIRPGWSEQVYTLHRFGHPDYDTYVGRSSPKSLRLRE